ncbi:hypothetical protein [Neptunomonas japonica]|uniref:hypothetical protein n=1 Tax=Neptunomonas japonica TaxID=417574 RepID=UPI00048FE881|nr:hypothetical protein [Neptunomonas japonica]
MKRAWISYSIILSSLGLLSGCATSLSNINLSSLGINQPQAVTNNGHKPMSVEQLLAQARNGKTTQQSSSQSDQNELTLSFSGKISRLTPTQEDQLHRFANLANTPVSVACAPGGLSDPFTAASLAISRCKHVSDFLSKRTRKTNISMQPELQADRVQISQ